MYYCRSLVFLFLIGLFCLPAKSWEKCPNDPSLEYEIWRPDPGYGSYNFDYEYYKRSWLIPVTQSSDRVHFQKTLNALLAKYNKSPSSFHQYYNIACVLNGPIRGDDYFEYGSKSNYFYGNVVGSTWGTTYPAPTYNCVDSRKVSTNINSDNGVEIERFLQMSQSNGTVSWFKTYKTEFDYAGAISRKYIFCNKDQNKSQSSQASISIIEQVYRDSNGNEATVPLPGYLVFTIYNTPLTTQPRAMPGFSGF